MALTKLEYTFQNVTPAGMKREWSHTGVVGSGDLEVLMERQEPADQVRFQVVTPVKGFEEVWEGVLERFARESAVGGVSFEIHDNNATPFVVRLRLRQALEEAGGKEDE